MNQDMAQLLFEEGAFLIISDMPLNTEFGIDWNSWSVGPKFLGVKMIPPGPHFVFYSAKNKFQESSPRTGFFHCFKRHEIVPMKWNAQIEQLVKDHKTENEISALKDNIKNMDSSLGAYPYETLKKWVSLTDKITSALLNKLNPVNGVISAVPELVADNDTDLNDEISEESQKKRKRAVDKDGLPLMKTKSGTEIQFTKIPKRWYPKNATPFEISKHSMDSTYALNKLLETYESKNDILGELQYSFVCFVLGQVYESFEQWKKLVHILCFCDSGLKDNEEIYMLLITILYHQILEIPEDFFVDIVSSNNFLVSTLNMLFNSIRTSELSNESKDRSKKFCKYLTKKFKWNFKKDPDDWAPVVVEM